MADEITITADPARYEARARVLAASGDFESSGMLLQAASVVRALIAQQRKQPEPAEHAE